MKEQVFPDKLFKMRCLSLRKRFNQDKSMVSRGVAKLMKQSKIRKGARSFAKPCPFSCPYKACSCLQRRFWYSHRDSNPNRQNRNLKSYPLDYGSKRRRGKCRHAELISRISIAKLTILMINPCNFSLFSKILFNFARQGRTVSLC